MRHPSPPPLFPHLLRLSHLKTFLPYLFLPPDAEPSAEDQKLEQEGKLYISYGTDEEVHEMYQMVSWEEDGLSYMLSTFSDAYGFEDLIQMAQEVIDTETE